MAKQTKAAPADIEVLGATLPEHQLAATDGKTITGFLAGLVPFFRQATALENRAKAKLALARTFTLPKPGDVDGDAALQTFIKEASAERKAVEKHWEITGAIHQFQRKLVAARDRVIGEGTKEKTPGYLVEAQGIAQRLHNTYVEDARRRAAEEQERIRKAEEERQAEIRRQDLERMENEALAAEAASADLSERERVFTEEIARGKTPYDAARTANFAQPRSQAEKLLKLPKILLAIAAIKDAAAIREQAAAVKAAPLDVQVETVRVEKAGVGTDRTTYAIEFTDPQLLREAVLGGKHGIPTDILTPDQVKGNAYARDFREIVNRWPGCRLVKKTTTV